MVYAIGDHVCDKCVNLSNEFIMQECYLIEGLALTHPAIVDNRAVLVQTNSKWLCAKHLAIVDVQRLNVMRK